ncbi:MAG: ABC transporter ATP-binding protein, partial [Asgard group archaeon]|nr:ABC transporter ATP-binding protein [Asgard group archaeon]
MNVWKSTGKLTKFRLNFWIVAFASTILWLVTIFLRDFAVQELIDKVFPSGSESFFDLNMRTLFILLSVFYILGFVFKSIMDIVFSIFRYSAEVLMRKNMMSQLLRKPGTQSLPVTSGESISRFRGDVFNTSWFSSTLAFRTGFILYAVASLVYMFFVNWKATIFIFIPFILILTIGLAWRKQFEKLRKARRKSTSAVTDTLGKIFGSIQTFKVTNTEKHIVEHFKEKGDKRRFAWVKEQTFIAFVDSIFYISIAIGMGIILLIVGRELNVGAFTVGNLYFFQMQLWWIGDFLWLMGDIVALYQQSKVSYDRIMKLIQDHKDSVTHDDIVKHGPIYEWSEFPPYEPIIRTAEDKLVSLSAKNITFKYPGTEKGIEDVTITIPKGSVTVITGRIGSGKTTLLRALLGLVPIDSGKLFWNDEEIPEATGFMKPPKVAYTPQIPYLFSETLHDNILLNIPGESVNIDEAVKLAVFEQEVDSFDEKLETIVGPKGVRLSGGQKQRLAAARMFAREPEILVFDDLSSALDVETEQELWKRLFTKDRTATCLAVSHRPIALHKADNVIVMKDGKIEAQGKLKELLRTN